MTNKERVLKKYPKAYSYRWGKGRYGWHVKAHHPRRLSIYGSGPTANSAWADAVRSMLAAADRGSER